MDEKLELKALLQEMKEYGEENHIPIINENGLKVLVEAVDSCHPHRVLEIGTAIGYSALYIASHSAPDVEITTLELSEERAAEARAYWQRSEYDDRIHQFTGDAGELLNTLSGDFDFVFIDAAKGQYPDYFRKVYPLLTDNAVVVADNVLFRGYVRGEVPCPRRFRTIAKRLKEYLELVENSGEFDTVIREDGDGLAISRRHAPGDINGKA